MKVTIVILVLFCASAAFGQASAAVSALSAQPVVIELPSHPQHAGFSPLGHEQSLSPSSAYTVGQGERPLWEVAPPHYERPLGDIARAFREEHAKMPKAVIIREN